MTDKTTAVQVAAEPSGQELKQLEAMLSAFGQDLSLEQVKLSWLYASKRGLDILSRQLVPTVMKGKLTFITTIDGFRVIAERSGDYAGQAPIAYGPDKGRHPEWAEATVYRHSWGERGLTVRAYWDEFCPEGNQAWAWNKMPHVMIGKVAEAQALRKAFPNDMSGMYSEDEMAQAGHAPARQLTPDQRREQALGGMKAAAEVASQVLPPPVERPDTDTSEEVLVSAEEQRQGLEHAVTVREAPEGLRIAKKPDWASGLQGSTVPKLEIKGKYGRRNVTIILLGPIAEWADDAEGLIEGAKLELDGDQYEYEWAEGKPKALQLRNVTRMVIDGTPLEPGGPPEDEVEGQVREMEPSPKGPDSSAEPMAPSSISPPTQASGADLTGIASDIFEELDADVDPGRGGNPNVGAAWESLPLEDGNDREDVSFEGYFAKGSSVEVPGSGGRRMWDAWVTSLSMQSRYHVLMSEQVAEQTGADQLGAGEQVIVSGTWRHPRNEPVVLADWVRTA